MTKIPTSSIVKIKIIYRRVKGKQERIQKNIEEDAKRNLKIRKIRGRSKAECT